MIFHRPLLVLSPNLIFNCWEFPISLSNSLNLFYNTYGVPEIRKNE